MLDDTICALATAPGESGIAVIRVSGEKAIAMLNQVFRPSFGQKMEARRLTLGRIKEGGELLDEVLAVIMPGPHSYTGEDVAEIQCHGGFVAAHEILKLLYGCGCRAAEPGEFTRRAFVNGRLSLSQAEAVIDIISAKSAAALKIAEKQLSGALNQKVSKVADILLDIMAQLELAADYPEEAGDIMAKLDLAEKLAFCLGELEELLKGADSGRIYREGLATVIVGPVNAGKSTLLNAFLATERAIVTDIPGTTRDTIEEYYNLNGLPLLLVDTAGLRDTEDVVEAAGIERSRQSLRRADLVLAVFEGGTFSDELWREWQPILAAAQRVIVVLNKQDLAEPSLDLSFIPYPVVRISAKEGSGLAELKECMEQSAGILRAAELSGLINARQQAALSQAAAALRAAISAYQADIPADLFSVDIEAARLALGEITGSAASEDIINRVFERFCLGK
jgi:tRNA modification GTPase